MEYCFFADCRTIVGIAVGKAISIVPPIEASANEASAIKALSENNCGMSKGLVVYFIRRVVLGVVRVGVTITVRTSIAH